MASHDKEQLFTYDGRLATFKKTTKKRGSAASGRGSKALNWPHKQITPASLAKAGFWYNPSPDSPDNVECFLCEKSLDGWEAGDDPLTEHVTHASHCGWAVLSAIESEYDDYATRNPTGEQLVEARLASFADRWPHEDKKGWMCKVDRLVEAGWMYTPTPDSDDMATCVYCQLALDGWEPSDEPYDEHYKRSPNCAFFLLGGVSQPTKKTARGKSSRSSKASQSRLSTQSNTATTADITAADTIENPEDSVISTASTMTTTSKKGRGKKATAKGGKRKAAKKEEPPAVEDTVEPEPEPEDEPVEEIVEAPPPAKSTRGKKRGSAAVEDSIVSTKEAPAPKKKRATKTRGSTAETSVAKEDTEMTDAPVTRKASGTKNSRSSSQARKASVNSRAASFMRSATPEEFPDDDEIERQLEADLERQLTEDELAHEYEAPAPVKEAKAAKKKASSNYDMFNPAPVEPDEDEVDDELELLQAQMEMEEPQLKVAKKGRKAGARKASKQTQPKRPKAPSPPSVRDESDDESQADVSEDEAHNASLGSTSTVVKKAGAMRESNASRGRGRTREASVTSDEEDSIEMIDYAETADEEEEEEQDEEQAEEQAEPRKSTAKAAQLAAQLISSSPAPVQTEEEDEDEEETEQEQEEEDDEEEEEPEEEEEDTHVAVPTSDFEVAEDDAESSPIRSALNSMADPPSTPGSFISPSASAKQAALSPSQSPQSSDAENQPPSSVPTVKTKRTALAPLAVTPSKMSPSKRNVIAGLQSSKPWLAANLDTIFGTPKGGADKENGVEKLLKQGKELTSPEKQMTVEEWINYNADEAEKKLKHECERMVSRFESEGSRAMQVLEGLEVE